MSSWSGSGARWYNKAAMLEQDLSIETIFVPMARNAEMSAVKFLEAVFKTIYSLYRKDKCSENVWLGILIEGGNAYGCRQGRTF